MEVYHRIERSYLDYKTSTSPFMLIDHKLVDLMGIEPTNLRSASAALSQLSYRPVKLAVSDGPHNMYPTPRGNVYAYHLRGDGGI